MTGAVIKSFRPRPAAPAPAGTPRRRPPAITAHRLFPAATALWCGALGALACLAAGSDALGALVVHLHLPALVPAARPPLGMTARLLLAVLMAGLGGGLGLLIGLTLQRRSGVPVWPARRARPAAAAAPAEPATDAARTRDVQPDARPRRPLVVTEDVLPWPTAVGEPAEPPLRHAAHDLPEPPAAPDNALPPFLAAAYSAASEGKAPIVITPAEPVIVPALAAIEAAEPDVEPVAEAPAEPDHHPAVIAEPVVEEPSAKPVAQAPAEPVTMPLASLAVAAPQVPVDQAPLAELGLVQMIERLALAIAVRNEQRAKAGYPANAIESLLPLHRVDPLTTDPAGPLLRAKPGRAAAPAPAAEPDMPAPGVLHDPLAHAADWDDDHAVDLPPRFLGGEAAEPIVAHTLTAGPSEEHEAEEADPAGAEPLYPSLADMTMRRPELAPSAPAPLAPGDHGDPVVPFPQRLSAATPAPAPEAADRALRDALATLRRMSGQR